VFLKTGRSHSIGRLVMSQLLIKAEKITKTYTLLAEQIHAVRGLDLEIHSGEFIALMGPSGSGKRHCLIY